MAGIDVKAGIFPAVDTPQTKAQFVVKFRNLGEDFAIKTFVGEQLVFALRRAGVAPGDLRR